MLTTLFLRVLLRDVKAMLTFIRKLDERISTFVSEQDGEIAATKSYLATLEADAAAAKNLQRSITSSISD